MMYGLIIAAGKQSRFKSDVPKALMKFNDKTIVEHNIDILNKYCDNVFIVCSLENNSYFNQFENKIIIESGKGSGDAIFRAIKTLNFSSDDSCIITWGDAILNEKLVDYSINRFKGYYCTIPCTFEKHPYVELGHTIYNKKFVKFSKYGDNIGAGYHDQCLFICNLDRISSGDKFTSSVLITTTLYSPTSPLLDVTLIIISVLSLVNSTSSLAST